MQLNSDQHRLFASFYFFILLVLANRMAGKSISEMIYFVLHGTKPRKLYSLFLQPQGHIRLRTAKISWLNLVISHALTTIKLTDSEHGAGQWQLNRCMLMVPITRDLHK